MSEDNVEIARRWIQAYRDRDLEALQAVASPDIELRMASGDVLEGHSGLLGFARHGWEAELPHYPVAERYIATGDTVYALLSVEFRSRDTGEAVRTASVGASWRIQDGQVIAWSARPDRDGLLREAGVEE